LSAKLKSRTSRALRLTDIRNKLALTQEVLAGKIDVKPGTVAAWESAARATDYWPSTDILARFAALAAKRGKRFEEDCIWLLKQAGTLNADIFRVLDNQRNRRTKPRPFEPGEIVSLPFMDAASGYSPAASFVQTIELPASLLRETGSLVCVHIEPAEFINSFPFAPGGILVIDQSETDLELLLMRPPPSTPVAVRYSRLPNSRLPNSRPPNSLPVQPVPHGGEAVALSDLPEGLAIADLPLADGVEGVANTTDGRVLVHSTNAKELWDRWGPYVLDPKKKLEVSGIHVGWLALELAGQRWNGSVYEPPSAGIDVPYRIVSRGASVPGLWGGSSLDLTEWRQGPWPLGMLSDLIIDDVSVLGRVVLWLPEWSPAAEDTRKEPR